MRTKQEIEAEIQAVQSELQNVHGSPTEVYARIVGYYRSVRNWNKGKREEFTERTMFNSNNSRTAMYTDNRSAADTADAAVPVYTPASITVFTRQTCPQCPPVKAYCSELDVAVTYIDADTAEGFQAAKQCGVRSCPTVIMYNEAGNELGRAYSVPELRACCAVPCRVEAVIA
nr:anaerobic ribonucleoside-triphosphate reductase [uncultured Treponema sp.]